MIVLNRVVDSAAIELSKFTKTWSDDVHFYYNDLEDLYTVEISDNVPVFIKHWSGVNDDAVYLHIGSKILAIHGEVTIK